MPEQCQGSYVCIVNVNNNLGYYITSVDDFSHTLIGEVRKNITLNSKITLGQYTRVLFMNILNSKDGALLAIAPGDKIITAFRNNGVWEEKSSHFIATKSDFKVLKKNDVQFSDGFAEISFPGLTYDSAVCINQEYKSSAGVQNLVFTAQVRPNELIIYARNANDGSSYNGIIHIMAIAIG